MIWNVFTYKAYCFIWLEIDENCVFAPLIKEVNYVVVTVYNLKPCSTISLSTATNTLIGMTFNMFPSKLFYSNR